jgi:hypothetical protein
MFFGCKHPKPIVFKSHWFDPEAKRETRDIGLVEIQQSSVYAGDDVYIGAQQATQVYYLSYPCKTDERLQGWDVVYKVSPHGRLPVPNNEDCNINPDTYEGEFFQEDGLPWDLAIDLIESLGTMDVEDDDGNEVDDERDIELLEKVAVGLHVDAPPSEEYLDMDMRDMMMRLMILIISMKMFITNKCMLHTCCTNICNIMLFLIMSYFSFEISCFLNYALLLLVMCFSY